MRRDGGVARAPIKVIATLCLLETPASYRTRFLVWLSKGEKSSSAGNAAALIGSTSNYRLTILLNQHERNLTMSKSRTRRRLVTPSVPQRVQLKDSPSLVELGQLTDKEVDSLLIRFAKNFRGKVYRTRKE